MVAYPTEELVRAACEEFDRGNSGIEGALGELFNEYPRNGNLRHVLLKVTTLNSLYSTRIPVYSKIIPDALDMAQHIQGHASEIDAALAGPLCSPEIVDQIATLRVPQKKDRYYFSFATKYCSWHRPDLYPIWDSRVNRYVSYLRDEPPFAEFFATGEEYWQYSEFLRLMTVFQESCGLSSFTFKQIDKCLYLYGDKLLRSGD